MYPSVIVSRPEDSRSRVDLPHPEGADDADELAFPDGQVHVPQSVGSVWIGQFGVLETDERMTEFEGCGRRGRR